MCALTGAFEALGFGEEPKPVSSCFRALDLPSDFGHYRVVREIAAGGTGMVYEAEDTRLGRRVALKMLRQMLFASEQDRLRFQSEAEMVSRLDHPNIVPIHDVGEIDGQPYFTMRFIRGENLAERLLKKTPSAREATALLAKLARAVHHAHQRGILHRDLKPANVLLDELAEPWLTDFGLGKWLDGDAGLTLEHAIAGTPEFMSPEQAAGRRDEISTATDVWALGVLFYQMLTGRLPFQGESSTATLRQIVDNDPPAPGVLVRGLDRDLETLCLRCLEKDPVKRLASAGELAEELDRWRRGEPIQARPVTGRERLVKWARRQPFRAAAWGAFVALFLGAGAAVTWQWRLAAANEAQALASAEIARSTAYSATLGSALAARERQDLGLARLLLNGIAPDRRAFDWRLLESLCRGEETRMERLGVPLECVEPTPGGGLALITADGRFHRRDPAGAEVGSPRQLPRVSESGERFRHYVGLSFSLDGRRLAYAHGNVLCVLDAATLALLYEETSVLPQFAWLDDHRLLFGVNGRVAPPPYPEPGAWILDFEKVESLGDAPSRGAFPFMCAPLTVAPDRRTFVLQRVEAYPTSWARTLHVYGVEDDFAIVPEAIFSMPGGDYPGRLRLSEHGRYLAFSSGAERHNAVHVLEVATGSVLFHRAFQFPIEALAIDPEERRLGLSSGDSAVRLFEFRKEPARERLFLGHEGRVNALFFGGPEDLITGGADGTLRFWKDAAPPPPYRFGLDTSYALWHPAASRDGRRVLTHGNDSTSAFVAAPSSGLTDGVRLRNERDQAPLTPLAPLAVFADGRAITFDKVDGSVKVWAVEGGLSREVERITAFAPFPHEGKARRGVLSKDEKRLAGSVAGRVFSVDFEKKSLRWGSAPTERSSLHADHDLSPDGEWIASADDGPRVSLYRFAAPGTIVAQLEGPPRDRDTAVAFSRDGRRLYTGNEDGRVRVWDTATWAERPELGWTAHLSAVTAIALAHEGDLIATSGGGTLKLFPIDPEPGELRRRERLSFAIERPANWIQFVCDAEGRDTALLHSFPGCETVRIWGEY